MESSASRSIEITVLSGEDLRIDRRSVKTNAFVIVQTDSFNYHTTRMDDSGGSYPSWNEKLLLELPMHARFITLEVQCKTSSGNRSIGFAKIPVSDFIGEYVPENYLHFLSYRLRDAKGEKNGIINISVRAKVAGYAASSSTAGLRLNVQGYRACSSQPGLNVQRYASYSSPAGLGVPFGGVVKGVPVWGTNHA